MNRFFLSKPVLILCAAGALALVVRPGADARATITPARPPMVETMVETLPVLDQGGPEECANDWAGSIQTMRVSKIERDGIKTRLTVRPKQSPEAEPTVVLMESGADQVTVRKNGVYTVTFLDNGCVQSIR